MFRPGTHYPHLHIIEMQYDCQGYECQGYEYAQSPAISEQQLRQLCSCCFTVQSLEFALFHDATATDLQPLVELSELTRLVMYRVHTVVAAVAGIAGQLTGLRELVLSGLSVSEQVSSLRPLGVLTRLEKLAVSCTSYRHGVQESVELWRLRGKVSLKALMTVECWQHDQQH